MAVNECTYRLREDGIWECSVCGKEWEFPDGGPKGNNVYYCTRCGAKITRLEYSEWDYNKGEVVIKGEAYGNP